MSSHAQIPSTLPEPVRAVLALFEGPLEDVHFPDLDRDTLRESVSEVERRRVCLQEALETVQAARAQLEEGQSALLGQVRRAHAYASVYAERDEQLAGVLGEIKLDGRALAPKKKRGRPRKKAAAKQQTSLSVAGDAPAGDDWDAEAMTA